jgi:DNA-binding CsgD family transcriptional regulator
VKTTSEPSRDVYGQTRPEPPPPNPRGRPSPDADRITPLSATVRAAEAGRGDGARRSWAEEAQRHLIAWLHGDHRPRLLCTLAGDILWMNRAAQALPRESFPFLRERRGGTGAPARIAPQLLAETALDDKPRASTRPEFGREAWIVWVQKVQGPSGPVAALTLRHRQERPDLGALAAARRLTPAEMRIIEMMSAGRDTAAVAEALGISLETLRTHVKHAYRKLGVTSRGELFAALAEFLQP